MISNGFDQQNLTQIIRSLKKLSHSPVNLEHFYLALHATLHQRHNTHLSRLSCEEHPTTSINLNSLNRSKKKQKIHSKQKLLRQNITSGSLFFFFKLFRRGSGVDTCTTRKQSKATGWSDHRQTEKLMNRCSRCRPIHSLLRVVFAVP